jgi:hypothetical protein
MVPDPTLSKGKFLNRIRHEQGRKRRLGICWAKVAPMSRIADQQTLASTMIATPSMKQDGTGKLSRPLQCAVTDHRSYTVAREEHALGVSPRHRRA